MLYLPIPTGGGEPPWYWAVAGAGILASTVALAGWVAMRLAGRAYDSGAGGMRIIWIFRIAELSVPAAVALDVFLFRWPALVEGIFNRVPWLPLADDLLLLSPLLLMVGAVMAFRYRFEHVKRRLSLSLAQYLLLRFRTELALILAPWLALMLFSDTVHALWGGSAHFQLIDTATSAALVGATVVLGPWLLRGVWPTTPLPHGPLRERLEGFSQAQRFRHSDILVWHTFSHLPNAAIIGIVPWIRYVLLTDALIENCTEDEIEAVFAHEVGHSRQHHFAFYLLLALAFLFLSGTFLDMFGEGAGPPGNLLVTQLTTEQGLLLLSFAAIYWAVIFGYLSRRLEQQADIFSLRTSTNPSAFVTALRKLARLSGTPEEASSWRHFSIRRRTGFLEEVLTRPQRANRVELKMRIVQVLIVLLFIGAALRLLARQTGLLGL
jgi:STE24 endopeptidase